MDGQTFDALVRSAGEARTRRGALGLLIGGAATAALARIEPALGRKKGKGKGKGKKKKRCKKPGQGCGGKNKKSCCKGITCTSSVCTCPTGTVPSGGKCVPLVEPECVNDSDCGNNESCINGSCTCLEQESGRCIRRCDVQADCPGASSCRNHFPEDSPLIEDGVCVDEPFILCDAANCAGDSDCDADELCIATSCSSGTFKCSPFSVF